MVFNVGTMEQPSHPDWILIQQLGGPAALARELKLPEKSGTQTVQNWKTRGIPARVKLQRPDLFLADLVGSAPTPEKKAA